MSSGTEHVCWGRMPSCRAHVLPPGRVCQVLETERACEQATLHVSDTRCIVSLHQHPLVSSTSCPFETTSHGLWRASTLFQDRARSCQLRGADGGKQYTRTRQTSV